MRRILSTTILLFVLTLGPEGRADEISDSRRTALVQAVEQVQPAVVSIHVTYRERVLYRYRDPYWDFFTPFYYTIPGERNRTHGGSGLIVTKNGYILTNDHVIRPRHRPAPDSPYRVTVSLLDGNTLEAEYIASDISFDLAILKVEADDLPVAPLGNSDDILVGEWAIAIGNPFDLGPTVSGGLISAVNRDFQEPQEDYYYRDMIQTDAAINPGNSGGPLVNALGEVIGINSFIYTGSDYSIGSIGIGFAIPINTARTFLDEIRQHGKVRQPWIGFYLQNLDRRLAEYLELPSADGALVTKVVVHSPAYLAGLEIEDVIVGINGEKVRSKEEATAILQGFRVDDLCNLNIVRDGKPQQLQMRLAEWPGSQRGRN